MMPNFVLCFGSKKAILQKLVVVLQVQISLFFRIRRLTNLQF